MAQREEGPEGGREEKEVVAMALSPFRGRGFYDMQSEMNRMFDEMFGGLARVGGRQQGAQPMQWAPALDVLHEDGDVVVRAELPGVKQEDVDVTLHRGVLTISGERKEEKKDEGGAGARRVERLYGTFFRRFTLPDTADAERVEARVNNGVLELSIPKKAQVQPKKIKVGG